MIRSMLSSGFLLATILATTPGPAAPEPATPKAAAPAVIDIVAGGDSTCALQSDGVVACWGLINPEGINRAKPFPAVDVTEAVQLSASLLSGAPCAVTKSRQVLCFGMNDFYRRIGSPGRLPRSPITFPTLTQVDQVSVGTRHVCAVHSQGRVSCWGDNSHGQLGTKTPESFSGPIDVPGVEDAAEVRAGESFSCARRRGGQILCWGGNEKGEQGNDTLPKSGNAPAPVEGIEGATGLFAGLGASCATLRDGGVKCWGGFQENAPSSGAEGRIPPTLIPELAGAVQLAWNELGSVCGVHSDGRLVCRGPRPAPTMNDAVRIARGSLHSCVLRRDGTVACWGGNSSGQCGTPASPSVPAPVTVAGLPVRTTGKEQEAVPHPFLARLRDGLREKFKTEAAKRRIDAVSLGGTASGDSRALSLLALDSTLRGLGPRVMKSLVRSSLWPSYINKKIIQKLERMPPPRKSRDLNPELQRALRRLADSLMEESYAKGAKAQRLQEDAALGVVGLDSAMENGGRLFESESPDGDADLIDNEVAVFDALVALDGETRTTVDTAVRLLSDMAALARKTAPRR
jgi:hypothetical protein